MVATASDSVPVNLPIPILSLLIGAAILLFGRKLFWLCVAAVGFATGVEIAPHLVREPSTLLALTLALVLGFIGALLALGLQKLAIAIVGFLTGGKLTLAIAAAFFLHFPLHQGVIFLLGGVIGALLLLFVFDWALVVLSSVVGAYLVQSSITLPPSGATVLFVVLAAIGLAVQVAAMRGTRTTVA